MAKHLREDVVFMTFTQSRMLYDYMKVSHEYSFSAEVSTSNVFLYNDYDISYKSQIRFFPVSQICNTVT